MDGPGLGPELGGVLRVGNVNGDEVSSTTSALVDVGDSKTDCREGEPTGEVVYVEVDADVKGAA